jgi:molecular chaperone HscB
MADYFEALGIQPSLNLALEELQQRFYARSRELHPDRFVRASAVEQARALELSSLLNDAWRTLRNPITRAEYLLSRHGLTASEQSTRQVPPELLEEVFALNEAMEELKDGDEEARPRIEQARAELSDMQQQLDAKLQAAFVRWDQQQQSDALADIRSILNKRRYIENLLRDANEHLSN